jgi:hypothetical protein
LPLGALVEAEKNVPLKIGDGRGWVKQIGHDGSDGGVSLNLMVAILTITQIVRIVRIV